MELFKSKGTLNLLSLFFITLKFISLVNLIIDKEVVKELIQKELNTKNLETELNKIISGNQRQEMLSQYEILEQKLGGKGASEKTADLILNAIKK